MTHLNNIFQSLQNKFFDSVVTNRLVYNTCWEDPRIDRALLDIDSGSKIVMLTSAGCNALDYLLDRPSAIHCVDANPAQNALMELKLALFRNDDYQLLWNMFGDGREDLASLLYKNKLAKHISVPSKRFWNRNINYFSKTPLESSFYFRGTSGKIAHMIHNRIKHKGVYNKALKLLNAQTLEEQAYYFAEIENQLWSAFYKWLIKRNTTMAMLGVPASQRGMIDEQHRDGLFGYIQEALNHVFTQLPISDNYFWRVYLTGSYTPECCPQYLKQEHFELLKNSINNIRLHTTYLTDFLEKNPGSYSHFVLLDHQDWLANTHPLKLEKEWREILKNARPGAKILFRSAGVNRNFLPSFTQDHIRFLDAETGPLHLKDRVGTYGSTFLAEVQA